MTKILDQQVFVFSIDLLTATSSQIATNINLRFAADALILKSVENNVTAQTDVAATVQIWTNVTNDGLIGAFPNDGVVFMCPNTCHRLNNSFQSGSYFRAVITNRSIITRKI